MQRRQQRQQRKRADGEGSVFQRANGVWVALTPSPERRAFTSRTSQSEAMRRRGEYLRRRGTPIRASASQLLGEYLADWLGSMAGEVSARTHDGYRTLIDQHIVPHAGTVALQQLAPPHVQRVLDAISSPWVRSQVYRLLKAALQRAVDWDVLSKNPVVKIVPPATPKVPVIPLDDAQFFAFLDAIRTDRLRALWLILATVGLRRGEAIALARSAVNLDAGTVTVVRSLQRVRGALVFLPVKTEKGNRTIVLPPPVVDVLREHVETCEGELLFTTRVGTPLEPRNVTRRFHRILKRAGIPHTKLHNLRHTAVSILLREGADIYAVQAMAGHARPSITLEIYGHLISGPSLTADKMADVLNRRKP